MKIQRLIFLIFTTIVVFACVTDHPSPQVLKISENTLRFSGNGGRNINSGRYQRHQSRKRYPFYFYL